MIEKENVYAETETTEATETVENAAKEVARKEDASAVLGKFKDVDALARAYSSLQAEFTRRSQRLKELERQAENSEAEKARLGELGAEKLRKNAQARKAAAKQFDSFVFDMENNRNVETQAKVDEPAEETKEEAYAQKAESGANECSSEEETAVAVDALSSENEKEVGENTVAATQESSLETKAEAKDASENHFTNTQGEGVRTFAEKGETALSSEELYQKVSCDEQTRLRIIGEYLASIGKTGAPVTFAGSGVVTTPPLKAKSILDAGDMALRFFKSNNQM
jgi:hypothetical protein